MVVLIYLFDEQILRVVLKNNNNEKNGTKNNDKWNIVKRLFYDREKKVWNDQNFNSLLTKALQLRC